MLQADPSGRAVKGDLSVVGIAGLNPAGKWISELITRFYLPLYLSFNNLL
jgi:hypothetical protein